MVVAGTNFGRVHAAGVLAHPDEFELVAILSRGSAASRRYAAELGVPHCTDVAELPADVDAACVAVGSAVSGGRSAELACALLGRGIAVLAEHPMHPDELATCLRAARRAGTGFRISTHYPHVAPVRTFLATAERLRARSTPLFVDAAGPVHVLHPLLDVLGRALGGLRPWAFAEPAPVPAEIATLSGGPGPLRSLHAVLAGVPLTLRVQNQLHPGDRDNHALLWHRIAIGTDAGVLTLADTHGPVLWSPRFHAARDADHRLVLDGGAHLALPSTSQIGPAEAESFADVMGRLWPDAVAHALRGLRQAVHEEVDPLKDGQFDLTVSRMWADLVSRLGPPESIRRPPPHPLPVEALAPEPSRSHERHVRTNLSDDSAARPDSGVGYGATAEFFEIGAAEHATLSGGAVASALAGVDTSYGAVVEIGAGTGLVTAAVAGALPGARILAAEPSTPLRAVLTSRVVRDPDLRARVTIVPESAQELRLPERISAAVLCGVVGHLDEQERRALWRRLAERMPPGAPIVVELMGLAGPERMPPTRLASAELGRQRYEWWFGAEPDDSALRLRSTWRVHSAESTVREVCEDYRWFPFGLDQLAQETGLPLRRIATPRGDSAPMGVLTTI